MTSVASGSKVLNITESDVQKLLASHVHLGTKNCTSAMSKYVSGRTKDGVHIVDLHATWEKLMLAARVLVAIENPQDITVCSTRLFGQRAIYKFSQNIGCNLSSGRFIPGTFTNQIQAKFQQPRVLIVTDPRTDHQALAEARLSNIPVIAFCDTDAPLQYVDIAIPCNNRGKNAIAMMYWLLTREVLRMRGDIPRGTEWETKVDLFIYRDPEEALKAEEAKAAAAATKEEGLAWEADQDDNAWSA